MLPLFLPRTMERSWRGGVGLGVWLGGGGEAGVVAGVRVGAGYSGGGGGVE